MEKVSVIIPTYNREKFIVRAINSVLSQSHRNIELLVIDDGSTDKTFEIAKFFKQKYPNFLYFYQKNKGPSAARNKGILEAKGDYIVFLDSDDYFFPDFIKKCLECLLTESYDLVIPKAYYRSVLDEGEYKLILKIRDEFPKNHEELYVELFKHFVGCIKMLIKKQLFQKVGLFDESLATNEDLDLWIRLVRSKSKIGMVKEEIPLWVYFIHEDSLWHSPKAEYRRLCDYYSVLKKYIKEVSQINPSLKKIYAEKLWTVGKNILKLKHGDFFALKLLLESQMNEININRLANSIVKIISKINL